ncbi:MAG: hypothetical protein HWE27_17565 [Gammaproteobacteria bacterium]|nr:hypothetical protein [Gammaproteobacteria bacterium]
MKRLQQNELNEKVIEYLFIILDGDSNRALSYKTVCLRLNELGLTTSRGNQWTPKRLFRMLQRNGISGLWGLKEAQKKGISGHYKKEHQIAPAPTHIQGGKSLN